MNRPHNPFQVLPRRDFIKRAAASGAALAGLPLGMGHALAQTAPGSDYRALVCLFMYGGNDAGNTLIPYETADFSRYQAARSNLALPYGSLLPITPSNTQGTRYALHPAMPGMQAMFNAGQLAWVANVGALVAPTTKAQWQARSVPLPDNLFSHSDQQNQWQAALYDAPRTGWGGRVVERIVPEGQTNRGYSLISLSGGNMWENGDHGMTGYKISSSGQFGFNFYTAGASDPLSVALAQTLTENRSHVLEQGWLDVVERSVDAQRTLAAALSASTLTTAFPNTGLGNQLRTAARLIAARGTLGVSRQCFFCSIGGFDTHGEDQLQRQTELLGEINNAVVAFNAAMVELDTWHKVTLFSASDFGRTFTSNGKGSDHGWGAHQFVMGGAVKGGQLHGSFPQLIVGGPDDSGNQGNWIPTTSIDSYAATLARWFGASPTVLADAFPNLGNFNPDAGFVAAA